MDATYETPDAPEPARPVGNDVLGGSSEVLDDYERETVPAAHAAAPSARSKGACGACGAFTDVAMWRDVGVSAGVFVAWNAFFIALTYYRFSLLTLLCYMAIAAIGVCLVYTHGSVYVAKFTGKKIPVHRLDARALHVSRSRVERVASRADSLWNAFVDAAVDVLYARDLVRTAKAVAFLFAVATVGKLFSFMGLIYTLGFAYMTVPFTWHRYRAEIKAKAKPVLAKAVATGVQIFNKVNANIPRAHTAKAKTS